MGKQWIRGLSCAAMLMAASAVALAQTIDFEGLRDNEPIGNYYSGGLGGFGSGPGPNLGISFAANALALIRNDMGGTGNFRNNPSGITTMYFLTGVGAFMNVPAGFTTGFSVFYASVVAGTLNVYSGLNGTGTLLASLPLPANNSGLQCNAGVPAATYCNWSPTGVTFAGTAMSVDFGGTANQIGFDNITINSAVPGGAVVAGPSIPVPALDDAALALLSLALAAAGLGAFRRRSA